jgi:hypothetical protein
VGRDKIGELYLGAGLNIRILAVITGDYGVRHAGNIEQHAPPGWDLQVWRAPTQFPLVIDYPEDFLPESLPAADLILSFAEHKGVAELLPEIAGMCAAQAVIAPIDSESWLPRGLARQLRGWLERMGVACATPKPLCSLTETHYDLARRERVAYADPLIAAFARRFGKPAFQIEVNPHTRLIEGVQVQRDTVCGCGRYVAERLVGVSADDAEQEAGMLHHHFPCLASMGIDSDYGDTLMHVSGNLLRDDVAEGVKAFKRVQYIAPGTRTESGGDLDET